MYDYARRFMQEHGNGNQWINGYPSEELISNEIKASHSFVCENEQGELVGTFCYIEGIDPTYLKIYEGEWLNDEPYAVINRMASNGFLANAVATSSRFTATILFRMSFMGGSLFRYS